jgi:hypothetical protein
MVSRASVKQNGNYTVFMEMPSRGLTANVGKKTMEKGEHIN